MKKILLIMLLAIIGLISRTMGQGTCTNASILSPTDTIIQLSANDSVAWFMYQTTTNYLKLSLYSPAMADAISSIAQQADVRLYSGNCNNLSEILNFDSLSPYVFFNNNLTSQTTYYIKVNYRSDWNPKLLIKNQIYQYATQGDCIHNCNLIANGDFSSGIFDSYWNDLEPFYYERVSCWCAAWGSPMMTVEYDPTTFNNAAYFGCGGKYYVGNNSLNGSEGIYQNINIEPNRKYNLNFKYRGFQPITSTIFKLHILITNDNFQVNNCLGIMDNGPGFPFNIIPVINNIVWESSFFITSDISQSFSSNIQTPINLNTGQYKLLFYMEYIGNEPSAKHYIMIDDVNLIPANPVAPKILGNFNNCDPNTTYSIENPNPNLIYNWSITPVTTSPATGTIYSGQYTPNISVLWGPIDNSNPAVLNVEYTDANGCSASGSINVYDCCKNENGSMSNVLNDEIINSSNIITTETYYLNGVMTVDNEYLELNYNNFRMGPMAKIIVKEPYKLIITAPSNNVWPYLSIIQAGCNFMWDGIYVSDPTASVEVTGKSTIKDAINGIVSDNGGVVTLNEANMTDNFYNVKITNTHNYLPIPGQPYPPYPGSVINTNFNGSASLALLPHIGHKTYMGIYCNNANNLTIGDDANTALRNYFSNMRFGIYANNSDLYIYNNKFTNIVNGTYIPSAIQKYYPEGAIYAVHNDVKPYILSNTLKVGANITEPLKRNYFENCNTGIYSFQYVNTLNNNDFKDCYNGISLVNISSGTEIRENMVYTSSASIVMPGKGISVRNAHQPDDGIDCLIEENHITNKQIGISMLGVKSAVNFTRVTHNYINNYITGFPNQPPVPQNEKQTGISVSNCDGIEVSFNNINRNYPALGSNFEDQSILGIWTTESRGANIFQNYMTHMGSGIYTNGLLTNTQYNCNIFDDNFHGIQFGINSSVSHQGTSNGYNPYNKWLDYNPQTGHERMLDNNGLNSPGFYYYYDPSSGQEYDPTLTPLSGLIIPYIQNGEYLCVNNGTIGPLGLVDPINNLEAREVALGQIVRDEKYYGFLEEEYKAKDREYVYAILREDPSIMNMGGADDNVYLQFYNDAYNSDIERVLQMREEMYEQNLELAREKLSQIADDSSINTNRRIVDNIYIDSWASGIYDFTQAQENALSAVANLPAYAGGDAVYTARVMLNIDPMDIGVDYAKPPQNKPQIAKENPVKVFPNPASSQLTIAFSDIISNDAVIEIYGNMGNLVLSETMHAGNYTKAIDVSKLNSGLYFYNISLNGTKVTSGKLTILNK